MRPLVEFQRLFAQSILEPSRARDLTPELSPQWHSRIAIHRSTVIGALGHALSITFPSVVALVGENCFAEIAAEFSTRFPPHGPVLYEFGAGFPEFLRSRGDLTEHPMLADLASFDWQIDLTGHRPMHVFAPAAVLSSTAALRLDSSLSCLSASFEVDVWRDALSDGQRKNYQVSPAVVGEWHFLFWRAVKGVMVRRVSKSSYRFFSNLIARSSVEESLAAARIGSTVDEDLTAIQQLFSASFCQIVTP